MSKPFHANSGSLKVSYTYKGSPKGTGTLNICDVSTGKYLITSMMYAGKTSGTSKFPVPSAGVYVAQTTFPLGSGGGDVSISQ